MNPQCWCFNYLPGGLCTHDRLCNRLTAVPAAIGGIRNNDAPIPPLPNTTCTVYTNHTWGDWGLVISWLLLPSSMCSPMNSDAKYYTAHRIAMLCNVRRHHWLRCMDVAANDQQLQAAARLGSCQA